VQRLDSLFLLLPHDLRGAARFICCHQDIAADSCFALGMLAHFAAAEREPSRYRDLYWECGMLGQVLYQPRTRSLYVYFPNDCAVSLLAVADRASGLEVGLVGREGMVGAHWGIFNEDRTPKMAGTELLAIAATAN